MQHADLDEEDIVNSLKGFSACPKSVQDINLPVRGETTSLGETTSNPHLDRNQDTAFGTCSATAQSLLADNENKHDNVSKSSVSGITATVKGACLHCRSNVHDCDFQ